MNQLLLLTDEQISVSVRITVSPHRSTHIRLQKLIVTNMLRYFLLQNSTIAFHPAESWSLLQCMSLLLRPALLLLLVPAAKMRVKFDLTQEPSGVHHLPVSQVPPRRFATEMRIRFD